MGGEPIISGRHEHWQRSPTTLGGLEFGPQGFGSHGFSATTGSIAKLYKIVIFKLLKGFVDKKKAAYILGKSTTFQIASLYSFILTLSKMKYLPTFLSKTKEE